MKDHKALSCTFKKNNVHGRLARWIDFLADYDFEIMFRPGKKDAVAKFYSRELKELVTIDRDDGDLLCSTLDPEEGEIVDVELVLKNIRTYLLGNLGEVSDTNPSAAIRRSFKQYMIWESNLV